MSNRPLHAQVALYIDQNVLHMYDREKNMDWVHNEYPSAGVSRPECTQAEMWGWRAVALELGCSRIRAQ